LCIATVTISRRSEVERLVACDALSQLTIGGKDAQSSPPLEMMGIHASERFVTIWLGG
jgi:hypothetical protein